MSNTGKQLPEDLTSLDFNEMLGRLIQTDPKELRKAIATDLLQARERTKKRIEEARKEIEDGARPKKGRFSL